MPAASLRPGPSWVGPAMQDRRFLISAWSWRVALHTVTTALLLLALTVPVVLAMSPLLAALDPGGGGSLWVGVAVSLPLLAVVLVLLAPAVARLDLARTRLVDRRPVPRISEPPGFSPRWRHRLTQRSAWLRVVHLATLLLVGTGSMVLLLTLVGSALVLLAAPLLDRVADVPISLGPWTIDTTGQSWLAFALGVPAVAASGYLAGAVASGHVLLARLLLVEPASRFEEQVGQLIRARARLVHGFDAERRRIERDLHDVAQQRVVTLTMHLGLAELDLAGELGTEHPITREVATAREHATELMAELRALIHGIHPQVLTDLGVGAAVDQLAATMPLPVEVRDELGERPARHVESTLYSCLNEALTNAARHSGAHRVTVTLRRLDGTVLAEVRDDGRGGADPARGSGLVGLADRAAVLDGTVTVSSPPGGPTLLRIALPDDRSQEP